jgi:hypothetical protein
MGNSVLFTNIKMADVDMEAELAALLGEVEGAPMLDPEPAVPVAKPNQPYVHPGRANQMARVIAMEEEQRLIEEPGVNLYAQNAKLQASNVPTVGVMAKPVMNKKRKADEEESKSTKKKKSEKSKEESKDEEKKKPVKKSQIVYSSNAVAPSDDVKHPWETEEEKPAPIRIEGDLLAVQKAQKQKEAKQQQDQKVAARGGKSKHFIRSAAGQVWEDKTLDEWAEDDFRIFAGDLGNEVNDAQLGKVFAQYPSFLKAKVVRDKRTQKTKGFGFISFSDAEDCANALREMNGKYCGNRPIKLRRSQWQQRNLADTVRDKCIFYRPFL